MQVASSPRSEQRTVLVTGATSGIGLATVRKFADRGVRVLGTSRDPDRIPDDVRVPGVEYLQLDQGDLASITACAKAAGPVDFLINNAGQSQGGAVEDLPPELLEWLFRVNVIGPMALTRAVLPQMRKTGGRILFIGSMMAEFPVPFQSSYAASKLALRGFVTALRTEVRPYGIEACLVQPGYFRSAIDRQRSWHSTLGSPYQARLEVVSTKVHEQHQHAGDPDEVAERMWRLLDMKTMPIVSMIGGNGGRLRFAKRFMSDRLTERLVARRYGLLP
jgi:NAD(P)-dependent dehydrogenase (short-subunit alcohol dehydrogenase family)